MKVLLVNGSPRKEGNTFVALKEVANQLAKHGVDSEIVWIGTKPVRGCIACGTCHDNRCSFNDDITNTVIAKMEECDGLVIGSPVYYGQPAGQVCCLQQRMMYAGSSVMANKPAAGICVCRRGGATAAFQSLNMPFQMTNMPVVTSQYWNILYGRTEGESALDVEGLQTVRTLADNMAWLLKKIATGEGEAPVREPRMPMNFIR
ncbi:MAG: flavodoxin family protein [Bacteroidales bacterium]|nr:flavodoxin family protein [Candidatus Scybalocola fimicaballi]